MIKLLDLERTRAFGAKWLASWATVNWKYTIGLYSPESRSLVYDISNKLGFESLGRQKAKLPKVSAEQIVSRFEAELVRPQAEDGNVSLYELLILCSVVRAFNVKAALEIGTFDGRTSLNMALNMQRDGHVYTLDLPSAAAKDVAGVLDRGDLHYVNNHKPGQLFDLMPDDKRRQITQLLGDSATFDFSPHRNAIDLVFIDGSHAVDYVRRDTRTALALLRDGNGFVFWHDYDACVGVIHAVDELHSEHPEYRIRHIEGTKLAFMHKTTPSA